MALVGSVAAPGMAWGQGQVLGPIRLGVAGGPPPDLSNHYHRYAQEVGIFKDMGVAVEIRDLGADQIALRALEAGEIDVAFVGCGSGLQAISAGSTQVIISAVDSFPDAVLVGTREIGRLREMEGRVLGVSAPGALSHAVPQVMVQRDGGDPAKMKVVAIGGSAARSQALIARKVDAAVLNNYYIAIALQSEHLHAIADGAKVVPDFLYACEVSKREVVQQKGDALQAFVTAIVKAARWAMQNPDRAAEISQRLLPDVKPAYVRDTVRRWAQTRFWNPDGIIDRASFDNSIRLMVQTGAITSPVEYDKAVWSQFAREARARLGAYTP
jgi:ABC-type nitrate/sulfonate/bicarbonate transport system substrate-binding protein